VYRVSAQNGELQHPAFKKNFKKIEKRMFTVKSKGSIMLLPMDDRIRPAQPEEMNGWHAPVLNTQPPTGTAEAYASARTFMERHHGSVAPIYDYTREGEW
jgi:hypothetical protein